MQNQNYATNTEFTTGSGTAYDASGINTAYQNYRTDPKTNKLKTYTDRIEAYSLAYMEDYEARFFDNEDTPPRNHTNTFVNKTHGLQARWDKNSCQTCHRQDYCDACHETAYPLSHAKLGFGKMNGPAFHCETSCQLPVGNWKNTVHQNCIVCHKTRPVLRTGIPHQMD